MQAHTHSLSLCIFLSSLDVSPIWLPVWLCPSLSLGQTWVAFSQPQLPGPLPRHWLVGGPEHWSPKCWWSLCPAWSLPGTYWPVTGMTNCDPSRLSGEPAENTGWRSDLKKSDKFCVSRICHCLCTATMKCLGLSWNEVLGKCSSSLVVVAIVVAFNFQEVYIY